MKKIAKICLYIGPPLLMLLLACTPGISFTEDFGRHLLLGQLIVENGFIPKTNYLTYTYPEFPFVNHHWLSEVLFYVMHSIVGFNGLIWFKMLLMTSSLLLVITAVRTDKRIPLLWVSAILAAVILGYRAHLRPELFTYFCVACLLFLFERIRKCNSAGNERLLRLLLIIIMVFWANAHIYFIFGVGMLGAFAIECYLNNPSKKRLKKEAVWLVLSIICCCFNPNGYNGFLYPFMIFSNYGIDITENLSPLEYWQDVYNPMLIALPFLSIVVIVYLLPRIWSIVKAVACRALDRCNEIRLANIIIVVASLVASWMMARSTPLLALSVLPFIAGCPNSTCLKQWSVARRVMMYCGIGVCVVLNCWLIYGVLDGWYCRVFPSPVGPTPFGFEIAGRFQRLQTLKKKYELRGPLFTDYNIGSLVEYELWPERGYVDNRPEAFPAKFWKNEYLPALALGKEWEGVCKQRKINAVIVSLWGVKELYIRIMVQNPGWVLVHLDEMMAVFVKNVKANKTIIEQCGFNADKLNKYVRTLSEDIVNLQYVTWWERQVVLDSVVYRLYGLICIGRNDLAWPYIYQLHKQYPDYQVLQELIRVTVPQHKIPEFNSLFAGNAKWPLAAKQVLDRGQYLQSQGKTEEAKAVYKRGLWFFPLSKKLQDLTSQ